MVDRPIKKADRPAQAEGEQAPKSSAPAPVRRDKSEGERSGGERSGGERSERGGGGGRGKGRRDEGEEKRPPANPAFARGPKPPKAQPEVVEVTADDAETPTEEVASEPTAE
jgi:hypothetical protein